MKTFTYAARYRLCNEEQEVEKISQTDILESLIDEYGNLIFSICYRMTNNYFDSEDLAQETFLSAYKNLDNFDGCHPKAWLSRIATNKCLDYLKSAAKRTEPTEDNFFLETKSTAPTPLESCMENEVKEKLLTLCRLMKPPYDEIAMSYFYQEMTVKEIAQKQNKNVKTIQTQVYRAKAQLKKLWKEVFT